VFGGDRLLAGRPRWVDDQKAEVDQELSSGRPFEAAPRFNDPFCESVGPGELKGQHLTVLRETAFIPSFRSSPRMRV
jgi:hypothetical protein